MLNGPLVVEGQLDRLTRRHFVRCGVVLAFSGLQGDLQGRRFAGALGQCRDGEAESRPTLDSHTHGAFPEARS